MTTELITCPENFEAWPEGVMSNFDHEINESVATAIKGQPFFAQYAGWNFCGEVWWDAAAELWCCEVWQYHTHVATISADTLEEIMEEVSDRYGYD